MRNPRKLPRVAAIQQLFHISIWVSRIAWSTGDHDAELFHISCTGSIGVHRIACRTGPIPWCGRAGAECSGGRAERSHASPGRRIQHFRGRCMQQGRQGCWGSGPRRAGCYGEQGRGLCPLISSGLHAWHSAGRCMQGVQETRERAEYMILKWPCLRITWLFDNLTIVLTIFLRMLLH